MELSPLRAARGSTGGRQLRTELPPTLGQGGSGFVQVALKHSWEDPLHSWGFFFFAVKSFQPTGLGTILVPCNGIFILCSDELLCGLERKHKPSW